MGEQNVNKLNSKEELQLFVKHLLNDVKALETMLADDWFETDIMRIGAEQEMFMVDDKYFKPALIAVEVLEEMKEFDWVGTELAKFNLETNLSPREFVGDCFSLMEKENNDQLGVIKEHLKIRRQDSFDWYPSNVE